MVNSFHVSTLNNLLYGFKPKLIHFQKNYNIIIIIIINYYYNLLKTLQTIKIFNKIIIIFYNKLL